MPKISAESKDVVRDQIVELFNTAGISQAELCRRSGVNKNTVYIFLNGERAITTTKATKLLRCLQECQKKPRRAHP